MSVIEQLRGAMEESMHVGEQETSLQDQSYHTIRRKIVYLDYKPGEKLGVKQLCDDLDMGRTPVREALVRLAQEGLVRTVPQSGTYVSPINLTLAESACYIREHLEKQVIVECCARATSAGIEQLDRAIALQEKAMAEEDRIGFFLSDNLMHRMIFSIACRSTVWSWLDFIFSLKSPVFIGVSGVEWLKSTLHHPSWPVISCHLHCFLFVMN